MDDWDQEVDFNRQNKFRNMTNTMLFIFNCCNCDCELKLIVLLE